MKFGDEFYPELGFFSGVYIFKGGSKINGRFVYIDKRIEQNAMFAYCKDEQAWTFTFSEAAESINDLDPCDWKAKSSQTSSYDLLSTTSAEWFFPGIENGQTIPFQHFVLISNDCQIQDDVCGHHGQCVRNECDCNEGWYGLSCEFRTPCPVIGHDKTIGYFPDSDHSSQVIRDLVFEIAFQSQSKIILPVQGESKVVEHQNYDGMVEVYDRPVYVNTYFESDKLKIHIMFFTGTRWLITTSDLISNYSSTWDLHDLSTVFKADFHYWSNRLPALYASEPEEKKTASESAVPVGLRWFKVSSEMGQFKRSNRRIETAFECALCSRDGNSNPCQNNGKCRSLADYETGKDWIVAAFLQTEDISKLVDLGDTKHLGYCECKNKTSGFLCEKRELSPEAGCYDFVSATGNFSTSKEAGCMCHDTCERCAAGDGAVGDDIESPFGCLTCFDGTKVKALDGNGIGCCGGENCNCHKTCGSCGQNKSDKSDCFTCHDGNDVQLLYADGRGCCGEDCKEEIQQ